MKYVYLAANCIFLVVGIYMFAELSEAGNWAELVPILAYVVLPFGIGLFASYRYMRGKSEHSTWAMAGAINGFLACLFYAGAYINRGPEISSGLVIAIVPIYHLIALIVTGGVRTWMVRARKLYGEPE